MTYVNNAFLERNRKRSTQGFVYFLRSGNFVKIGFTADDPEKRRHALQAGNPEPIDVWAFFKGTMEDERLLHAVFSPLSVDENGLWLSRNSTTCCITFCRKGPIN